MSASLTDMERTELRGLFDFIDTDSSNTLDVEELWEVAKEFQVYRSIAEIRELVSDASVLQEDQINFTEFLLMMERAKSGNAFKFAKFIAALRKKVHGAKRKKPSKEDIAEMRKAFEEIDADGNGELDREELEAALRKMNRYEGPSQIDALMEEADITQTGTINFTEFVAALSSGACSTMSKMASGAKEIIEKRDKRLITEEFIQGIFQHDPTEESIQAAVMYIDMGETVPTYSDCEEQPCCRTCAKILLSIEALKEILGHICRAMANDLLGKLREIGLSMELNTDAIVADAVRMMIIGVHRFAHNSGEHADAELHRMRMSFAIAASDKSMQDVRDAAVSGIEDLIRAANAQSGSRGGGVRTNALRTAAVGVAGWGAREVVADVGLELAAAACSIQ